jgi:hypothetical protein
MVQANKTMRPADTKDRTQNVNLVASGPVIMQLLVILLRFHQMIQESQTVAVLTSSEAVPSVDQARHPCSLIL